MWLYHISCICFSKLISMNNSRVFLLRKDTKIYRSNMFLVHLNDGCSHRLIMTTICIVFKTLNSLCIVIVVKELRGKGFVRIRLCQLSMWRQKSVLLSYSIISSWNQKMSLSVDSVCLFLPICCCSYLHRLLRYG